MALRMKKKEKKKKKSYNKTPHYIKIEKVVKKNIIPAHKGNIITGENLYKTPCIKPIYKYKRICASAEPAQ